jgi:hypothetical protein
MSPPDVVPSPRDLSLPAFSVRLPARTSKDVPVTSAWNTPVSVTALAPKSRMQPGVKL